MLDKANQPKITDLDKSALSHRDLASSKAYAGTVPYMSPELYHGTLDFSHEYFKNTDIWSLGCILYELVFLSQAFPYGQKNNPSIPDLGNTLCFSPMLSKSVYTNLKYQYVD